MNNFRVIPDGFFLAITATAEVPTTSSPMVFRPFPELKQEASRYLEFRAAVFSGWHPVKTRIAHPHRFADSQQLHLVKCRRRPQSTHLLGRTRRRRVLPAPDRRMHCLFPGLRRR